MSFIQSFKESIFKINKRDFEKKAIELFNFQFSENPVYNQFVKSIHRDPPKIKAIQEIPFLPIEFFKYHDIKSGNWLPQHVFESSGTTGSQKSRHFIHDLPFYTENAANLFEKEYFPLKGLNILALLPSYLERDNSSLVYMVNDFVKRSGSPYSGFYLETNEKLIEMLTVLKNKNSPTLLIGVTFALLDFAESNPMDLSGIIIMETGGMKGRRKELTRQEVHSRLKKAFNVSAIHSEYGMTELLSQAYAKEDGFFKPGPTMQVFIRDINDPFDLGKKQKRGGINVIDLANFSTCAFIETQDQGIIDENENFQVLGRLDNTEQRGCSLLLEQQ